MIKFSLNQASSSDIGSPTLPYLPNHCMKQPRTLLQAPSHCPSWCKKPLLSCGTLCYRPPPSVSPIPLVISIYSDERQGIAVGVLAQPVGPTYRPVAYLSKQLDPTLCGWQPCLRALGNAAELGKEAPNSLYANLLLYLPLIALQTCYPIELSLF